MRRRPIERYAGAGDAIPDLHLIIWLDAGVLQMRPCSNVFEERLGRGCQRTGTVGEFGGW